MSDSLTNVSPKNLKIALVQYDIYWENKQANIQKLESLFSKNIHDCDLVILPEMFTTGFSMRVENLAEPENDKTVEKVIEWSRNYNACFTGSLIIREKENYYNRLIWTTPDGLVSHYNKRHLFSMGNENKHYAFGEELLINSINEWNICPLICYDLRFPVWSRNIEQKYDTLIYVANWPSARQNVWDTLLKARAIENQCYVIGVNRVGIDNNNIEYVGGSKVINPKGEIIAELQNEEEILKAELNYENLSLFREKFPVLSDADNFSIIKKDNN